MPVVRFNLGKQVGRTSTYLIELRCICLTQYCKFTVMFCPCVGKNDGENKYFHGGMFSGKGDTVNKKINPK